MHKYIALAVLFLLVGVNSDQTPSNCGEAGGTQLYLTTDTAYPFSYPLMPI